MQGWAAGRDGKVRKLRNVTQYRYSVPCQFLVQWSVKEKLSTNTLIS